MIVAYEVDAVGVAFEVFYQHVLRHIRIEAEVPARVAAENHVEMILLSTRVTAMLAVANGYVSSPRTSVITAKVYELIARAELDGILNKKLSAADYIELMTEDGILDSDIPRALVRVKA